jgi:hypothetical protein
MKLAKRLLLFYPKLINDFYTSDEFYGEWFSTQKNIYALKNLKSHFLQKI